MENLCYFVSSRGLLKSCSFHSSKPVSSSQTDIQHLISLADCFDGMSIYVCSDSLSYFVAFILPKIRNRFTLVSGDSDMCVPKEVLSSELFNMLVTNPFLIRWFAQNAVNFSENPLIVQLPIGLDYHTISNSPNHPWSIPGEGKLPRHQENILVNIRKMRNPFFQKKNKTIFVNFSKNNDRFGDRSKALQEIPRGLLSIYDSFLPRTECWKKMSQYSFVLSPFGNGMDCHRTWEALCLGCIPIIKKGIGHNSLFENLPVLIVQEWTDINDTLLQNTMIQFKEKHMDNQFQYEKLTLSFWTRLIKSS
jgi:hypothetical protein